METIVEIVGMTEAVLALVFMAVIGIAGSFISKKDVEKLNREETNAS